MADAGTTGSGIADHSGTAVPAESPAGEQEIHSALLHVPGCFCSHALRLLKVRFADDGGHPVRHPDGAPDIHAGITFVGDDPHEAFRLEQFPAGSADALIIQLAADPRSGEAGAVQIEYVAHGGGLIRLKGIPAIRAAGVAQDAGAVVETLVRIIRHAAGDVFRQLAAVPFCGSFQHAFQEHAGRSFRDGLHRIEHPDTEPAELSFVDGGILPVTAEAVHLPGDDGII